MKIISLTAENIKKLVVVEIRPDGNVVQITGKNGQGKTSVLDSIWWALAGTKHIQAVPIRKGANEAIISLDLGEITVTRKFKKRDDDSITTSIVVENADGARFPSPQSMLDSLLGELTFDPLAFTRMDGRQQFDALRRFVPDVDFDAIDGANRDDYQKRTDINRQAKEERTVASQITVPDDAPTEPIDEGALVDQLQQAGEHNAEIETRKARRQDAVGAVAAANEEAQRCRDRAEELHGQATSIEGQASEKDGEAAALQKKIDEAPALPKPIDTAALRQRIDDARAQNTIIERVRERSARKTSAETLEAESTALTEAMKKRNAEKRQAIASAKLPVEGIGFGEGEILLNDVPLGQASDAEQLRASIAIAMASNPKLRVIRVRDGSLLDEDSMAILGEMADESDYQIWIERVDNSGKVGFVLEDGQIKGAQHVGSHKS